MKATSRFVALALVAWYIIGMPPIVKLEREKHALFLRINARSDIQSTAQVYYNRGVGIREEDSHCEPIAAGTRFDDYQFPLPPADISALRFDPLTSAGAVTIRSAAVVDVSGRVRRVFNLADFIPHNQIKTIQLTPEGVQVVTDDPAPDPSLDLRLITPLYFSGEDRVSALTWLKLVGYHALAALAVVIAGWLLNCIIKREWGRNWLDFSLPPGEEIELIPIALYLYALSVVSVLLVGALSFEQAVLRLIP